MIRNISKILGGTVLILSMAAVASAGTYTLTLKNGTTFETRYKPVTAEWDDSIMMIGTDQGNWIALRKDDVTEVISSVEESGFGYQLNTTTVFMGWSPNEDPAADGGDGGEGGEGASVNDALPDPNAQPDFTLEQFVNVPTAGAGVSSQPARNF
jgi:hypothetical protein